MQQANTTFMPLVLERREKTFSEDGGHRSRLPEDTLREYAHLIGRSAIIEEVERTHRDPFSLLQVHVARLRTALGKGRGMTKVLRSECVGRGMTEAQARASALGEAVERYSGIFRGDEFRIKASYQELSDNAIHPNACMNFSPNQYRDRDKWNRKEAEYNWVPEPFDEEREIEWTPVWSLTEQRFKYVATAFCYFGYPHSAEHDFCRPDSNGNAAGNNLEEAILHGFLELVERDSVALWWYNQARRPQVRLASFGDAYFQAIVELYRILGNQIHVFDISTDFSIPAFAATSSGKELNGDWLLGFGAHLEARIGIARAITEMNQSLVRPAPGQIPRFYMGELLDNSFLEPCSSLAPKIRKDYSQLDSHDLREDLTTCVELARERGLEILVLDQTRADTGMPVVKVIVPGMRSWWARFAPGRLYQVPVEMGWQTVPLAEEQLNSCHLII
jgi:oxazoline/thiazoline synthase